MNAKKKNDIMKLLLLAFFLMASPILLVVLITFPWLLLIGALVGLFCWAEKSSRRQAQENIRKLRERGIEPVYVIRVN